MIGSKKYIGIVENSFIFKTIQNISDIMIQNTYLPKIKKRAPAEKVRCVIESIKIKEQKIKILFLYVLYLFSNPMHISPITEKRFEDVGARAVSLLIYIVS